MTDQKSPILPLSSAGGTVSVAAHGRVYVFDPVEDAPCKVRRAGEALLPQHRHRPRASCRPTCNGRRSPQPGSSSARRRGSSPSGIRTAPGMQQIGRLDGSRTSRMSGAEPASIRAFRSLTVMSVGATVAQETAVLVQAGDRRVAAANRAVRILSQLQVAEPHLQRVVDEKAGRSVDLRCPGSA